MQPANLINSLQALNRSSKPLVTTEPLQVAKLEPGQRIQGTIQEQLSPGLFKVQVAGQSTQIPLPGSFQSGNVVELQVISTNPHLTFSLFASSTPIATQEQISSTSRMLANLAELPLTRTAIESTSDRPVWPASGLPIDSKQLAVALRDALANSGLFYESHQAEWVRGERSTAQLLVEPQNQLPGKQIAPLSADKQAVELAVALQGKAAELPIAKELISLVQQQLHTLETHQLTWTGQVWPEQQMQWEIQGEPEHQASSAETRQWSTELELALPRLGDVHARLIFSRGEVILNLQAADSNATSLFNRNLPQLHQAMSDAGIQLTSKVVEKHESS